MASGLLSSTAMTVCFAPMTSATMRAPSITFSGQVHITVSSEVMYGSHSQAFMSRVSVLPAVESIFEFVG